MNIPNERQTPETSRILRSIRAELPSRIERTQFLVSNEVILEAIKLPK